ncbi:hypothetical protein KAW11_03945, partial [Candidatus Bathyarchaeota archaeon]|nr:hypothetical protein [Candidatus Bathyarchaeota archaeon]
RWEKMGIDGTCIEDRGFSCDVVNACVLLNHRFPYLGGGVMAHTRVVFRFCFRALQRAVYAFIT